ncbi:MFS transporter [Spirochaeta dissipatitropha]
MNYRVTQGKLIAAHFLFALILNSIPSLLTVFQQEFNLGIFQSSMLPLSINFSIMIANLFIGFLIAHIGQKFVLLAAVGIQFAGLLVISIAPVFIAVLSGFMFIGFATGAIFTALSTIYAELPEKYQNFGLYHAFFGVGGVLAPLFASLWLAGDRNFRGLFAVYAIVFLVLLVSLASTKQIKNLKFREFSMKEMFSTVTSPIVLTGIAVFGMYAAAEIGSATWSVNAGMSVFSLSSRNANILLSAFWVTFTFSRLITDPLARRVGSLRLVRICGLIAALAVSLWIIGISPYVFPVLGLALGPIFPAFQKHMNGMLPRQKRGLFNGLTYLSTGISAMFFVSLMGGIGEHSLALAYLPVLGTLSVMFVLVLVIRKIKVS